MAIMLQDWEMRQGLVLRDTQCVQQSSDIESSEFTDVIQQFSGQIKLGGNCNIFLGRNWLFEGSLMGIWIIKGSKLH